MKKKRVNETFIETSKELEIESNRTKLMICEARSKFHF